MLADEVIGYERVAQVREALHHRGREAVNAAVSDEEVLALLEQMRAFVVQSGRRYSFVALAVEAAERAYDPPG